LTACFLFYAPIMLNATDLEFEGMGDRIEDENDDDVEDFIEHSIRDKQLRGGNVGREGDNEDDEKRRRYSFILVPP